MKLLHVKLSLNSMPDQRKLLCTNRVKFFQKDQRIKAVKRWKLQDETNAKIHRFVNPLRFSCSQNGRICFHFFLLLRLKSRLIPDLPWKCFECRGLGVVPATECECLSFEDASTEAGDEKLTSPLAMDESASKESSPGGVSCIEGKSVSMGVAKHNSNGSLITQLKC